MSDVSMYAGNSHTLRVTVTDQATSLPLDLTGASIVFRAAKTVNAAAPEIEKSLLDGVTIVGDPADGVFEVALDPEDTVDMRQNLYYECDLTESDGRVSTVATGTIRITPTLL